MEEFIMDKKKWLTTNYPEIIFEDNTVGRLKKEIWDASEAEIDAILAEYEIPSAPELGKAGCYAACTMHRKKEKERHSVSAHRMHGKPRHPCQQRARHLYGNSNS
jgi:hypothetical protein